jgi:hypothetical protein
MSFNRERWRAQHNSDALMDRNPRGNMASELIMEHLPQGMAREQVRALLGPPEFVDGGVEVYELGRSAYGVDYEQLAIVYADDRLQRADIRRT